MIVSGVSIRRAGSADALKIIQLYSEVYGGTYPDPLMLDYALIKQALADREGYCWMVGEEHSLIVASVVYRVDSDNRLAKVFGAAVAPEYRGHNLTEALMTEGYKLLENTRDPVEVVYATTRTVAAAPQKLTANLGYQKLGIFPNVHKTDEYETHCLAGRFTRVALARRFTDFALHPKLAPLFSIVRDECGLPPLGVLPATPDPHERPAAGRRLALEVIHAPNFVRHRFEDEKPEVQEHHWFFPFQEPNVLLTTPDQNTEIFAHYSEVDQHCALIAIRDVDGLGYTRIFNEACKTLRAMGVRYIEFIMRADEPRKIETALRARFIPSAYFPAMQLAAAGLRFDYVVFSRSFEILDFRNLKLEGVNRQYLAQYYSSWKEIALDPNLLGA